MKQLITLSLAVLLTVVLAACGNNNDNNDNNNATDDTVNNGEVNDGANNSGSDQNNVNDDVNGNNNGNDNDNDISFSDQAADQVATMDEVEDAAVIRIGDNAYVGVALKEGTNESEDLTNRISEEVKGAETNVTRVYVSTDPNFYQSINEYREQVNAGEPVEGLLEGINELVQRVFPNATQQ